MNEKLRSFLSTGPEALADLRTAPGHRQTKDSASASGSAGADRAEPGVDLYLDLNEGPHCAIDAGWLSQLPIDLLRRYPQTGFLERKIAARLGVAPERVLVTAGGDDAIQRLCLATLEPGRSVLLADPTFQMIGQSARITGADVVRVPWLGERFPVDDFLGQLDDTTGLVALVSPNNPTGLTIPAADLVELSRWSPVPLMLDLAYTEFADEDLTPVALRLDNVVMVRTFSKAFGLAGLRVGYAVGAPRTIAAMRAMGSPYPVSGLGLLAASEALGRAESFLPPLVARIRLERRLLAEVLHQLGADPFASQANFVCAGFRDAASVAKSLLEQGIAVRRFSPGSTMANSLRITCPGHAADFDRLVSALRRARGHAPGGFNGEDAGLSVNVPRSSALPVTHSSALRSAPLLLTETIA